MAIADPVTTTRGDVLSMVHCRFDYGHHNQIADHFFWSLLGETLSDAEIAEYADDLARREGYGDVDRDAAIENLTEWRDKRVKSNYAPT